MKEKTTQTHTPKKQPTFVQNKDFLWEEIKQLGGGHGIKNKYYSAEGGLLDASAYTFYGKSTHTTKTDGVPVIAGMT